ncbi:aspartate aminotransferase family protein [Mucisphaera calidilacus]|uniref:Acetylornithine aminotransferase n=1 Tax=Mucisphaera calidilacus TaxID=2527982 RepID=A0A518BWE7_9BACT|nr:aminotransferase class III-fold pyridoxal phosphate-dependent enzyme [Mucisphaera calidilacus]QDU71254.1 Acetylornithine aminotransferase [Mucisphaera calidilacus]
MTASKTQELISRADASLSPNYGRYPIAIERGEGSLLYDLEGKRYIDLFAGFGAPVLGHCHTEMVRTVTEQACKLWHVGNLMHTEPQVDAAERIKRLGFGGLSFFSHSGADANEAAIKLARLYGKANRGQAAGEWGRYKVVSATKSFHGRSFATMGATGQDAVRQGFEPLLPGFTNVAYNDLGAIASAVDDETVAVIVEPIQGEGGINIPDSDYFKRLRAFCDERDLLLIADEVWTGCGRTGRVFGHQLWDVVPDIMTLGKGVGGGLPVGVMCARPEVAEHYSVAKNGKVTHATTLGGNCLAMAATATVFRVIEEERLDERAERLGAGVVERLSSFAERCDAVVEARGHGLFIGVELDPDKLPSATPAVADVVKTLHKKGVMVNASKTGVLRLAPPLTIPEELLDEGLSAVESVLNGG